MFGRLRHGTEIEDDAFLSRSTPTIFFISCIFDAKFFRFQKNVSVQHVHRTLSDFGQLSGVGAEKKCGCFGGQRQEGVGSVLTISISVRVPHDKQRPALA